MELKLTTKVTGTDTQVELEAIHKRFNDNQESYTLLQKIGEEVVHRFVEYLRRGREKNPDGSKWKDLNKEYAKRKGKPHEPILVDEHKMLNSHDYQIKGNNSVVIYNNDRKAGWHMAGKPGRVGGKTKDIPCPLPERDWMWLEIQDINVLKDMIVKYVSEYVIMGATGRKVSQAQARTLLKPAEAYTMANPEEYYIERYY